MNPVHFSSATDEWATPQALFDRLARVFAFALDVCAGADNAKCPRYFTREQNGLAQVWSGVCWMNPPYGDPEEACKPRCTKKRCRTCAEDPTDECPEKKCGHRGHHVDTYQPGIIDWVRKARESARTGATVVCLLPARTDTAWWQDHIESEEAGRCPEVADLCFLRGRLKFGNAKNSAPFPSAIVVFAPACAGDAATPPVAELRESP